MLHRLSLPSMVVSTVSKNNNFCAYLPPKRSKGTAKI